MERDEIQVKSDDFLEVSMLNSSSGEVSHLALDIGGSLIKMVYFSRRSSSSVDQKRPSKENCGASNGSKDRHLLNGRLQFMKFETSKINECMEFISSMQLYCNGVRQHEAPLMDKNVIKATGGGAFKFADLFREKLGITLNKVDEMKSLVAGANFLLKAVNSEAFTFTDGQRHYMQIDDKDLYPFLLVNIGSGVSMIKVEGAGKFERVSGTSIGGGTFWGLGKLLTKCKSFDELLELSHQGNNREIDMLVGDIYGGMNYSKIGLSSTAIASSFGKPVSDNKELEEYRPEDLARSLLRMISNNIGQIAYLNALRFGLKKIFFGGFFIRGHDYTMDTISVAVDYWSGGDSKAMFLRHEGFLGALGAFMSYQSNGLDDLMTHQLAEEPKNAPLKGENRHGPVVGDIKENGRTDCRGVGQHEAPLMDKNVIKAIHSEAFTFKDGQRHYMQIDDKDLYPFLLVNIGFGVSLIKVEGAGKFERISGTSMGGGTFWGLGKLLTKCKSFDELLELSRQGNNREIDMLVGDIYGGMDYSQIGLSSTAIASSFGKPVSDKKELEEYRSEDLARSLLRMISNNIGQIAYLTAHRFDLKKIFFGGFFIQEHDYTMDAISVAVDYWSRGNSKAMFLRHERFLGALGAFMSYQNKGVDDLMTHQPAEEPRNACSKGENFHGPIVGDES